ncbi:MAG: hypothetical protein Q9169_000828 [Polycauliona sp. 2 TL-2023]
MQPTTAEDYYQLVKKAIRLGDLSDVESKLYYLVPVAARDDGQLEILEYLLSLGGKIGTYTIAHARSPAVFEVLMAHGWEVDDSTLRSNVSHPELVALFLSKGANPDSNIGGIFPLDIAALRGPLESVKLLFDGGPPNILGSNSAALHAAAQGDVPGRIAVMEYLLEQGADVNGIATDITGPSEARREVFYKCWNTTCSQYLYTHNNSRAAYSLSSNPPHPLITTDGCKHFCGSGTEYYSWQESSKTITTWVLPVLGLLVQLPFESNAVRIGTTSAMLTLESTAVSLGWFIFALSLSIADAFGDVGKNQTAHDLAIGLLLAWLPVFVIATIVDRNPIGAQSIRRKLNEFVEDVRRALLHPTSREAFLTHYRRRDEDLAWTELLTMDDFYRDGFFVRFAGQGRVRWHYGEKLKSIILRYTND